MKFGKFYFENLKIFEQLQYLAVEKGVRTLAEFEKFLSTNCGDKIVKK